MLLTYIQQIITFKQNRKAKKWEKEKKRKQIG